MILGISGSPRPNSVTASAVKRVLAESGKETEYISLAGEKNKWMYKLPWLY
jgi:multimeric flavodoxin WrbA